MKKIRSGTVGYSHRDWSGVFYPTSSRPRAQLSLYSKYFNVCELTQYLHQVPERARIERFASQIKTDLKFFVRIHHLFTHSTESGFALTLAKHYKSAFEPLEAKGLFAGFVANFPYAFKNCPIGRDYVLQLDRALRSKNVPFQADFRQPEAVGSRAAAQGRFG